jgi:hypothetical protein
MRLRNMINKFTNYLKISSPIFIFCSLALLTDNAFAFKSCTAEDGSTYFTDLECPVGTVTEDEVEMRKSNTYRARESINIDLVNDHERRYNTGRSWQWVEKKRSEH